MAKGKKPKYLEFEFEDGFVREFLKSGPTSKWIDRYSTIVTGSVDRYRKKEARDALIGKLTVVRQAVLSVPELEPRDSDGLLVLAMAESLRLLESATQNRMYKITPYLCGIYGSTYVAFNNDPGVVFSEFFKSHLTREMYRSTSYIDIHRLRPYEQKSLKQMLDHKLDEWAAEEKASPYALRTVREHMDEVIRTYGGGPVRLRTGLHRSTEAAVVVYYIQKRYLAEADIPTLFIARQFGVVDSGIRHWYYKFGMAADIRRSKTDEKRKRRAGRIAAGIE